MLRLLTRYKNLVNNSEPYIEARYIALRYIMSNCTIASVNHFHFTYHRPFMCKVFLLDKISYNLTCKNAVNTSYSDISPYFHTLV